MTEPSTTIKWDKCYSCGRPIPSEQSAYISPAAGREVSFDRWFPQGLPPAPGTSTRTPPRRAPVRSKTMRRILIAAALCGAAITGSTAAVLATAGPASASTHTPGHSLTYYHNLKLHPKMRLTYYHN